MGEGMSGYSSGMFTDDNHMMHIKGEWHFICYDWDDKKKTKTYYPNGLYRYNVLLPGCMTESQVSRLIRKVHNL